jgi:hypothetical protein
VKTAQTDIGLRHVLLKPPEGIFLLADEINLNFTEMAQE